MKKLLFLAVMLVTGISSAKAEIDESLLQLITTTDDVEITELTNDAKYPWNIADGVASSTNGKSSQTTSYITIKFRAEGDFVFSYKFTFDPYSSYDSRRTYIDGEEVTNSTTQYLTLTTSTYYRQFGAGEHEIKIAHYHGYYTSSSYSEVFAVQDISIKNMEDMYMDINLSEAGTLGVEALALVSSLPAMKFLRLSGSLNAADWNTINNMTGLLAVDMTNTTVKDIPASAFVRANPYIIHFPSQLETIGANAFENTSITGDIVLPQTVVSVGASAFRNCDRIKNVVLPAALTTLGTYAFYDCDALVEATLGGGFTTLPGSTFSSCDKLVRVNNCTSIKNVGSDCFYACGLLQEVEDIHPVTINSGAFRDCRVLTGIDLSKATAIYSYAFYHCDGFTAVDLPNVTTLDTYAFQYCSNITSVRLNDKITSVPGYAFQYCSSLEEIVLGASIRSLGSNCFYTNTSPSPIKRIYINAPAPPTVSSPLYTTSGITLYVPEYAMTSYKLDNYWSRFTAVEKNPYPVDQVFLTNKLELTSNVRIPDSPDLTLSWANSIGGSLIVNGNKEQEVGKFVQYALQDTYCPTLISRCNAMTSESSVVRFYVSQTKTYWYYICMPYDVRRSDITGTNDMAIAVRYYDSEHRANSGAGSNWKDVPQDGILKEGQGYIFCTNATGYIYLPATEETHNNIFKSNAVEQTLNEYPTSVSNDANWNLVGNPYPAYYDIYYMDYTAPITVWNTNNKTFTAYSIADDQLVLYPFQAFFVQKPQLVDAITFQTSGRQSNMTIDHSASAKPSKAAGNAQRSIINLSLTDGVNADKTRIVVNAEASDDFSADNDASKMIANEGTAQLYTLRGEDIYAINEGPQADGSVQLGMLFPADGEYTISAERADLNVQLYDYGVAVEMPYTFDASEGTDETRFVLAINGTTTAVKGVNVNDNADIYSISGYRMTSAPEKGVYIQNNKKIVK